MRLLSSPLLSSPLLSSPLLSSPILSSHRIAFLLCSHPSPPSLLQWKHTAWLSLQLQQRAHAEGTATWENPGTSPVRNAQKQSQRGEEVRRRRSADEQARRFAAEMELVRCIA